MPKCGISGLAAASPLLQSGVQVAAARRVGAVIAMRVIPRPHESLEGMLPIGKPQAHTAGK